MVVSRLVGPQGMRSSDDQVRRTLSFLMPFYRMVCDLSFMQVRRRCPYLFLKVVINAFVYVSTLTGRFFDLNR